MRTLPWRRKEEDIQWVKHEKTQIRLRREEREERLTAMGYLVRVCTSLLGLKIAGFFQFILLKISRAQSKSFGWLATRLPVHFSRLYRAIGSGALKFVRSISRALGLVGSGGSWFFGSTVNAVKALGTTVISAAKRITGALVLFLKRLIPQLGGVFSSFASWSSSNMRSVASSLRGFGENSQTVTTVITRRISSTLIKQRQILTYSALTLAVFGGVIGAVSMGVFSQLPKNIEISGVARIIDADLIKVGDVDIRLFGIDAPEPTQRCRRHAKGRGKWGCGRKAVTQLSNLVNNNKVTCMRKGTDNLGRIMATCSVDNWDVAAYMVREGLAWVSPGDPAGYEKFELAARDALVGIWRAKNDTPWNYREARWTEAKAQAPEGCPVKGNISGAGRVYYLPWSNQYDRVHIQPKKGERWFCNERDAIQAGWRMTRYP